MLYYILFQHFAPRGNKRGVAAIVAADSDEQVFEWIARMPFIPAINHSIFCNWQYRVEDDPSFKTEIIESGGEMFWDGAELSDLYYGKTLYGWEKFEGNPENFNGLGIFFDLREKK